MKDKHPEPEKEGSSDDSKDKDKDKGEKKKKKKKHTITRPFRVIGRFFRNIVRGKGKAELKVHSDEETETKGGSKDTANPKKARSRPKTDHPTDSDGEEIDLSGILMSGDGLQGGVVGEQLHFIVTAPEDAGRPHLKVDASGPSEPDIELEYLGENQFSILLTVTRKGKYRLAVYWGSIDNPIPGSPFKFEVTDKETDTSNFLEAQNTQRTAQVDEEPQPSTTESPRPGSPGRSVIAPSSAGSRALSPGGTVAAPAQAAAATASTGGALHADPSATALGLDMATVIAPPKS